MLSKCKSKATKGSKSSKRSSHQPAALENLSATEILHLAEEAEVKGISAVPNLGKGPLKYLMAHFNFYVADDTRITELRRLLQDALEARKKRQKMISPHTRGPEATCKYIPRDLKNGHMLLAELDTSLADDIAQPQQAEQADELPSPKVVSTTPTSTASIDNSTSQPQPQPS